MHKVHERVACDCEFHPSASPAMPALHVPISASCRSSRRQPRSTASAPRKLAAPPSVASTYLPVGMSEIELGDQQRYTLVWSIAVALVILLASVLFWRHSLYRSDALDGI